MIAHSPMPMHILKSVVSIAGRTDRYERRISYSVTGSYGRHLAQTRLPLYIFNKTIRLSENTFSKLGLSKSTA